MFIYTFKCPICGKTEEKVLYVPTEFDDVNTPRCSGDPGNQHDQVKMEKISRGN